MSPRKVLDTSNLQRVLVATAVTASVLGLTGPVPLPAQEPEGGPIPVKEARALFAEAEAVSDGGEALWGVGLYGPMLFVDRASRAVVANRPDGEGRLEERDGLWVGVLPQDVGIANTGIDWAGERWTMLVWPLTPNRYARRVLMVHEMFHRIQPELGHVLSSGPNVHLDSRRGRTLLRMEWRALQEALGHRGAARRAAIRHALSFRAQRHAAFPGGIRDERALELNEGLAEYTGIRAAVPENARAGWTMRQLEDYEGRARAGSIVRSFAYASGPAYGLLLDDLDPNWRARVTPGTDLGELLKEAYDIRLQNADAIADAAWPLYGGPEVDAEETERHEEQLRVQAGFRQRFEVGPTLTIPWESEMRYGFNPNDVTPFGEVGTVYGYFELRGEFGVLQVPGAGALMVMEGGGPVRVVLPAPEAQSGSTITGPGYTLELSEGWGLAPGEGPDDRVVRRR